VLVQTLIPGGVAAFLAWRGHPVPAGLLTAIAGFALVSGLFMPALFACWEALGQAIGKAVATAVTWLCLVPLFYLVFVPGRLILLLNRKDPMCRAFPTTQPTYWVPRAPVKDVSEYQRQF
jgi:hypothetical protein